MSARWALILVVVVGACSDTDGGPPGTTELYRGPARELAPSQMSQPTVPDPDTPALCPLSDVEIVAATGTPPDSDVVVTFRNDAAFECEIDLGSAWAIAHEIEPSVRLAPGGTAVLWGVADEAAAERECASAPAWQLEVNGEPVEVALAFDAPCTLVPTAFLPV